MVIPPECITSYRPRMASASHAFALIRSPGIPLHDPCNGLQHASRSAPTEILLTLMGSELVQQLTRHTPTGKAFPLVFLSGRKHTFLALSVLSLRKNEDVYQRPSSWFPVQPPAPTQCWSSRHWRWGSPLAYCGLCRRFLKTVVACIYPMLWVHLLAL